MIVSELIERLQKEEPNMPVVRMRVDNGRLDRYTTYNGFVLDSATPRKPLLGDDLYYVSPRTSRDEAEAVEVLVL